MLSSIYKTIAYMKVSKQLNKLKNLNVKAELCSSREEAKKALLKAAAKLPFRTRFVDRVERV